MSTFPHPAYSRSWLSGLRQCYPRIRKIPVCTWQLIVTIVEFHHLTTAILFRGSKDIPEFRGAYKTNEQQNQRTFGEGSIADSGRYQTLSHTSRSGIEKVHRGEHVITIRGWFANAIHRFCGSRRRCGGSQSMETSRHFVAWTLSPLNLSSFPTRGKTETSVGIASHPCASRASLVRNSLVTMTPQSLICFPSMR